MKSNNISNVNNNNNIDNDTPKKSNPPLEVDSKIQFYVYKIFYWIANFFIRWFTNRSEFPEPNFNHIQFPDELKKGTKDYNKDLDFSDNVIDSPDKKLAEKKPVMCAAPVVFVDQDFYRQLPLDVRQFLQDRSLNFGRVKCWVVFCEEHIFGLVSKEQPVARYRYLRKDGEKQYYANGLILHLSAGPVTIETKDDSTNSSLSYNKKGSLATESLSKYDLEDLLMNAIPDDGKNYASCQYPPIAE